MQPLAPGASGTAWVRVEIPSNPGSAADEVTVRATSSWDPAVYTQQSLLTNAVTDLSLVLAADDNSQLGEPGGTVTYSLVVTNTGGYTDSYTLLLANGEWPTTVAPTQTGILGPGQAADIQVCVEIPAEPVNQDDSVAVRAVSGWDADVYAEQILLTRRGWWVYLPVVLR
jgi:uncharacterized membrane protein